MPLSRIHRTSFAVSYSKILVHFLVLGMVCLIVSSRPAHAQGAIPNGVTQAGNLATPGQADSWTFSANAGDGIMIRVGSTNFTPHIQLYGPTSALVAETTSGNIFTRDGFVFLTATNGGPYALVVSATTTTQTGTYGVTLAMAPEPFTVAPADQGGVLANGVNNGATLPLGDLDMWNFTANANDSFMLRVGATNFTPWIRLYGPNGALVAEQTTGNVFARDGFITMTATNAGNYTVVLSATVQGQDGTYGITLAQAPEAFVTPPGQSGGVLTNGVLNPGTIPLGGVDMWSFTANANDSLMLRVGSTNFTPWIRLYGPNGALVAEQTTGNVFARDGFITMTATNAGNYTVVLSATVQGQNGDYGITLAQAPEPFMIPPGQSGGVLTNGLLNPGTIPVGGMNMWSFTANASDSFMLRVGATNFTPWIRVYGRNGALVGETTSGNVFARDGFITMTATNAGNYTVVLSATFQGQTGDYGITLAQAPENFVIPPGQSGGPLVNGAINPATLPLGALQMWSFLGTPGDSNVLSVVSTNFTPWIRVYGPNGALVGETTSGNVFARAGSVPLQITQGGNYNVVVSATVQGQEGTYGIKESRVPPDLIVPNTTTIDELSTLNVSISAQDPNTPVKPLGFALLSGPAGMTVTPAPGFTSATISWPTTEADGGTTNLVTVTVTDIVNNHNFIRTNSFNVVVREINKPPVLGVIPSQTVNELGLLTVSNPATEPDPKSTTVGYALLNAPAGATIDANGTITWTPTQTESPSTNTITTVVTNNNPYDQVHPQLTATNSFTVVVREVNMAPVLPVLPPLTVKAYTLITVTNAATENNIHSATAGYTLIGAPAGVTISPGGVITWTPNQVPNPTTNVITTVVSNANPFDTVNPQLSATNSFIVVVKPISPPVLQPITDQSVHFGTLLSVQASASDPDRPGATLTYSLDPGAPTNMTINGTSGLISWTPADTQVGTNTVTVRVTDNGVPPLSATTSFDVTVIGHGAKLELNAVTPAGIQLTISGDIGHVYELQRTQDLQTWKDVVQVTLTSATFPYVDPEPPSILHVFYRLRLVQ